VTRANPLLDSLSPDAEALLVYKRPDGVECHLVPVATSPVRARADKARFPTMTGVNEFDGDVLGIRAPSAVAERD